MLKKNFEIEGYKFCPQNATVAGAQVFEVRRKLEDGGWLFDGHVAVAQPTREKVAETYIYNM